MSLSTYNQKRSFSRTPEPRGLKRPPQRQRAALTFVIQKHDASRLHYDFRLELGGVLKSWAVPKGPSMNPKDKRLAVMTEDHPLAYADFEGKIPDGHYGAGDVIVWDRGVYRSSSVVNATENRKLLRRGLARGELSFVLLGEKLKGGFKLIKMKGHGDNAWLLVKLPDEYASDEDITARTASVLSGRRLPRDQATEASPSAAKFSEAATASGVPDLASLPREPMPSRPKPMLAKLVEQPFNDPDWLFEIKWDGYRALAEISNGQVALYSRTGKLFNDIFTPVVEVLRKIEHECILDGEIVAFKNGRPDFHTLQQFKEHPVPLTYAVFDILYLDGHDLRQLPLLTRKEILADIAIDCELFVSEYVCEHGKDFFDFIANEGLEGMIAKRAASQYQSGVRSDDWRKIKTTNEQEAIIIGYTKPRGGRQYFGALVLGAYEDGQLVYIGHSGGGFTDREMRTLKHKLDSIVTDIPPVPSKVPVNSPITWVKPQYVCQIKFTEWTKSGRMRQPIYAGLRIDKTPGEVIKEPAASRSRRPERAPRTSRTAGSSNFTPTNPDKVFWPDEGYTKGDVIEYYDRLADVLLPYIKDRPQNLNRHPNGISGKNFFQKNMTAQLPDFVDTKRIWSESNRDFINYIICNNKDTLLYLANLGCIELNPWNSRVMHLDRPDYLILDLDPNGRPWADLITVARVVKRVLDMACEFHLPKTSGKSGLHVIVPLGAQYQYDAVRQFAELLMRLVHQRVPELTSLERSPKKRSGKIYLDYLQNRFGQTLACAYSLRPYPGATVSTPLQWSEVTKRLNPARFTIKTIHRRLEQKGDLWAPVLERSNDLNESIRCLQAAHAIDAFR